MVLGRWEIQITSDGKTVKKMVKTITFDITMGETGRV